MLRIKKYQVITLFFLFFPQITWAARDFKIEPVDSGYSVLGYANGDFVQTGTQGCFLISKIKLRLHKQKKSSQFIVGVRFTLTVPYKTDSFDFLSTTGILEIDQLLTKKKPIRLNNKKLCLQVPRSITAEEYFLSMEIQLKHNKNIATTYSHELVKYQQLKENINSENSFAPIILTAPGGHFDWVKVKKPGAMQKINLSIELLEFDHSTQWPPSANFGFVEDDDPDDYNVQITLIKNKEEDDYLVVGYRITEDGTEVRSEAVLNLKTDEYLRINARFKNGVIYATLNNKPVKIHTSLHDPEPYVSAVSAKAIFKYKLKKRNYLPLK